jgi:hypothetical protein
MSHHMLATVPPSAIAVHRLQRDPPRQSRVDARHAPDFRHLGFARHHPWTKLLAIEGNDHPGLKADVHCA